MRYMRSLLVAFGLTALVAGVAGAGINPGNPGLYYSNNRSSICIDCHTVAPGGAPNNYASHFVYNPRGAASTIYTNSGGGWAGATSYAGVRNNGAYFKASEWPTGKWSKYGGATTDNQSYASGGDNTSRGAAVLLAQSGTNYDTFEIICESCHNLVSNVAGGNNLVSPWTSSTYTANTGDNVQVAGALSNATDSPLCVGCHGYLYAANDNNTANTARYGDTRNGIYGGATKKGNNHKHSVDGTEYPQNHHVMTGDQFNNTQAGSALLWRDVFVTAVSGTADSGQSRGQVPQRGTWVGDSGKVKSSTTTNFTCAHCHSSPHQGLSGTGASILRDSDADTTAPASRQEAIARIGETLGGSARSWMGFSDVQYCNDCHNVP